jgi:hypothetical protein
MELAPVDGPRRLVVRVGLLTLRDEWHEYLRSCLHRGGAGIREGKTVKQFSLGLGLAAVLAAAIGQSALAAKPTITRIEVNDVAVPDPFLSAE